MKTSKASQDGGMTPLQIYGAISSACRYGLDTEPMNIETECRRESNFREDITPEQILFESGFNAIQFPEQIPMFG